MIKVNFIYLIKETFTRDHLKPSFLDDENSKELKNILDILYNRIEDTYL
jgi:hypothetical protein